VRERGAEKGKNLSGGVRGSVQGNSGQKKRKDRGIIAIINRGELSCDVKKGLGKKEQHKQRESSDAVSG